MFRIGIVELGVTCLLISAAIILPVLFARGYARLSRRIRRLEERDRGK